MINKQVSSFFIVLLFHINVNILLLIISALCKALACNVYIDLSSGASNSNDALFSAVTKVQGHYSVVNSPLVVHLLH